MSKIKKLLNEIPKSVEEPVNILPELFFDIEDEFVLTTGEHFGRVAYANTFTAKNGNMYVKLVMGTVKKYGDNTVVHEIERVFMADFHTNSEVVKLFEKFGCIDKRKCYIERVLNKKVKFKVEENPEPSSAYKYLVTEIEPVDAIPEEYDFEYIKSFNGIGFDYEPILPGVKKAQNELSNNKFLFDDNEEVDFG